MNSAVSLRVGLAALPSGAPCLSPPELEISETIYFSDLPPQTGGCLASLEAHTGLAQKPSDGWMDGWTVKWMDR